MMTNILADTNILIYGFDKKSIFHEKAQAFLKNPLNSLFISSKNISEFFAVTSKLKMDTSHCLEYYYEFKSNANILLPTEKSLTIFETLIKKYQPVGKQVYDIEIVSMMLNNDLIDIATFNRKDFIHITEIRLFNF